jgi:hypothetical protein
MSKEVARNNLFKLVVDNTLVHCTILLQYRVTCFRQWLVLPPKPKQRCTTTHVCFFWGVSSNLTLLIVAKSCKMTCFARIMTQSIPHKKLEARWNSIFRAVYDKQSCVYQLTLILDLEVCLEMKMEGL